MYHLLLFFHLHTANQPRITDVAPCLVYWCCNKVTYCVHEEVLRCHSYSIFSSLSDRYLLEVPTHSLAAGGRIVTV